MLKAKGSKECEGNLMPEVFCDLIRPTHSIVGVGFGIVVLI